MNMSDKFYERDIKDVILKKRHLFLPRVQEEINKSVVIFEKHIHVGRTVTDTLMFTHQRGMIGVEIKTEYDSTTRLKKQLDSYSLVCDYVYVVCHDNHLEKVEQIIKKNGFHHVGIILYTVYKAEVTMGTYREASRSPKKNVRMAYQILWKPEIAKILGSFKRQMRTLEEKGMNVDYGRGTKNDNNKRTGSSQGLYSRSNVSMRYLSKTQMIDMIVNQLGEEEANNVLCRMFIENRMHPDKVLKFHHFAKKGDSLDYE
jgi:hypothetical protein